MKLTILQERRNPLIRNIEGQFQSKLIKELTQRFEGCVIMKNDPTLNQGIPDLTILYKDKWAVLECKNSAKAKHRPNQDFYVEKLNNMSFSAFIFPENKEEVLNELSKAFES